MGKEILTEQPESCDDGRNKVCRLNQSIYGLKQAGKQWNIKLDEPLSKFGIKKSKLDPCIYYTGDIEILNAIYVDDFLTYGVARPDKYHKKYLNLMTSVGI